MKKLKMKLLSTMLAFMLVLGVLTIGVFAATSASVSLGGTISFEAKDVQATISQGVASSGLAVSKENVETPMSEITFDYSKNATTEADKVATWTGLTFAPTAKETTISFSVTNNHAEKALYVSIDTSNFTISEDSTTLSLSGDNVAVTITNSDNTPSLTELAANGDSTTFTITIKITNINESASLDNFSLPIQLSTVFNNVIVIIEHGGSAPLCNSYDWSILNGDTTIYILILTIQQNARAGLRLYHLMLLQ